MVVAFSPPVLLVLLNSSESGHRNFAVRGGVAKQLVFFFVALLLLFASLRDAQKFRSRSQARPRSLTPTPALALSLSLAEPMAFFKVTFARVLSLSHPA